MQEILCAQTWLYWYLKNHINDCTNFLKPFTSSDETNMVFEKQLLLDFLII